MPYICIMRMRSILFILFTLVCQAPICAQEDFLSSQEAVASGGYPFWIYTPQDYQTCRETTPLIIFLHGASLCGRDLSKVLRYGPIDAVKRGLEVPALIVAPQNPGGQWSPQKLYDILIWMERHYVYNRWRVYVVGMSLGGYGTLDFAGANPDKIAAAIALCGGSTLGDYRGLGELPLWIVHGTADKAVKIEESRKVVDGMRKAGVDQRLRYEWVHGASHGDLARYFYLTGFYDWLFMHTLNEPYRPVDTSIQITSEERANAYRLIKKRQRELRVK